MEFIGFVYRNRKGRCVTLRIHALSTYARVLGKNAGRKVGLAIGLQILAILTTVRLYA